MRFQDKFYSTALHYSLKDFFTDGCLCDVTLAADGREFHAHKLILSAASPYFRIMFNSQSSFIESKQDKVNLHDIDGDALSDILKFIYSSDIEINDENVFSLMEASDLLQIHALRTFISFYLQKSLKVENCLHMYLMARLHEYHDLANYVFHFLLVHFSELLDKEELLKIPFDILLDIISSRLLDIPNEEIIYELVLKWVKIDVENRKRHLDFLIPAIDLNVISSDCLAKIKNNPLISSNLKEKLGELTSYSQYLSRLMHIFGEEKRCISEKFRYKAEKPILLAIGGECLGMASQSMECFDVERWEWSYNVPECIIEGQKLKPTLVLPPLGCARYYAASTNDAYNVYVMGGRNPTGLLDECEVFNVRTNQWKYFPSLPLKLYGGGAVLLENELIVVGGFSEEGISDKMWKLRKMDKFWVSMPPLNSPRFFHGTVTIGGYIFVLGGYDSHEQCALRTCEKFDPGCNKWFKLSSMHQARAKFGCAATNEHIYVIGGTTNNSDSLISVERYNIYTNEWTIESPMFVPRHSLSAAICNNEIYCIGGNDGATCTKLVERFSLKSRCCGSVYSMQIDRLAPTAATLLVPYLSRK